MGVLVLRRDYVFAFEVNPYLYPKGRILLLEGRDGSVGVLAVIQAVQLELRPWGLEAASPAGRDGGPFSFLLTAVLLLHHVAADAATERSSGAQSTSVALS